jgi:DNA-binding CsgD family transcriptional regulator
METLSHNDILALNRAIGEIYSARDLETFYSSAFSSIRKMVPYEHCSFNDVDLAPTRFLKIISSSQHHNNVINNNLPVFNAYIHEHPLLPQFASDKVFKTTDVASINQFKATAIYNEYYRYLDTETQIGFAMPISPETVSIIALSRNTIDFFERDRLILALLKPHCINALRNVMEFGRIRLERDLLLTGAEAEKKGLMLCRQDSLIICISEFAGEMLGRYFAVTLSEGDTLPEALAQWLETEAGLAPGGNGRLAERVERNAFIVEKDGKRLIIKLLNDVISGDYMLCMTESDPAVLLRNLQRYDLSPRETDVMRWLATGKTNMEIAVILNMSKRTVEKHMEHIFAKLGVETRAAAVAIAKNEYNVN